MGTKGLGFWQNKIAKQRSIYISLIFLIWVLMGLGFLIFVWVDLYVQDLFWCGVLWGFSFKTLLLFNLKS